MANDLKNLLNKQIHLKLASMPLPFACTVSNIETAGIWVGNSPMLEATVNSSGTGLTPIQNPVVFIPLQNIQWIVTASM
jgi:hypothetical protein